MNCTMCNYTPYNLYMDVPNHLEDYKYHKIFIPYLHPDHEN